MAAARSLRYLLAAALSACTLQAQTTYYVVDRVIDGDTVMLATLGTVRLIGVDTPEPNDPRLDARAQGRAAAAFLRQALAGQMVRVEQETGQRDKDGRALAYVYLGDGTLINAEIIGQGYGHAYTAVPFAKLEQFRALEREARAAGRGLWASAAPAPYVGQASALAAAQRPRSPVTSQTVYVTKTGTKYHRAGCRHLARSQISMALTEASARYGACSVCRPPTLSGAASAVSSFAPRTSPAPTAATSGRCAATTKKGTQCSRSAQAGRAYCWQH